MTPVELKMLRLAPGAKSGAPAAGSAITVGYEAGGETWSDGPRFLRLAAGEIYVFPLHMAEFKEAVEAIKRDRYA